MFKMGTSLVGKSSGPKHQGLNDWEGGSWGVFLLLSQTGCSCTFHFGFLSSFSFMKRFIFF